MENVNKRSFFNVKSITILLYLLIILALVYLYINSPAKGYEISIYLSLLPFWILIFSAISLAIFLLVRQVYIKNYNFFWHIFIALILCFFIILTLPVSRGYFFYGGNDPIGHYLRVQSILSLGYFGDNYYPVTHILSAEISMFSIQPQTMLLIISPIFSVIFIVFSYFLAKEVFKREDYAVMAAALSIIPLYSYYYVTIYPHALAIFLLPIIFYAYFRANKHPSYKIAFIIVLLLQAFVHVVPSFIIFGGLVVAEIVKMLINRLNIGEKQIISFNSAAVLLIVFFAWWSSYTVFEQVDKAVIWMEGESQTIPRMNEVENVSAMGLSSSIELFLKMYGSIFGLTILTLIAISVMAYYFLRRRENNSDGIVLSSILLISAAVYLLYFLSTGFATIGRFLGANYGVWAMPVITAFLFTKLCSSKIKLIFITVIIIALIVVGTLSIYRSDWILQPNWQVTSQDITAKYWETSSSIGMMGTGIIASPWGTVPTGSYIGSRYAQIPPHFGYDCNDQLGDYFTKDSIVYYGETRQRQASNNAVLKNSTLSNTWALAGFNSEDFNKLNYDNTVNFIYTTGEVKILFVKGLNVIP